MSRLSGSTRAKSANDWGPMKRCIDCHETKPIDAFYTNKGRRGDGRKSECKLCSNVRSVAWHEANRERARDRTRQWHLANPDRSRAHKREWMERNADRMRLAGQAHSLVHEAIKRGELIRGTKCESCDKEGFCEASHEDYSRPLDVRWLCRPCHRQKDAQQPRTKDVEAIRLHTRDGGKK